MNYRNLLLSVLLSTLFNMYRAFTINSFSRKIRFQSIGRYNLRNMAKSKNSENIPAPSNAEGWVTVNFGEEKNIKAIEMDDRLKQAERWVSKKLTDEESQILNRSLGIEDEIMAALADEDDDKGSHKPRKSKIKSILETKTKKMRPDNSEEMKSAARVRGFLEINPYLCSGCGTPFQSKTPDAPGYLQKEKLQDHRARAELIKDKQEAIKILEMAGLDINSSAAEELLRDAKISSDVIAGVRSLAQAADIEDEKLRKTDGRYNDNQIADEPYDEDDLENDDEDDIDIDLEDFMTEMGPSGTFADSVQKSITKQINNKPLEKSDHNEDINNIVDSIDSQLNRKKRLSMPKMPLKQNKKSESISIPTPIQTLPDSICICQRCYRLQQYGQVEENLRPGWSSHELLTPDRFEQLLTVIKDTDAVVLCIVDIFDLHGSLLPNLKSIAGSNPIVVAANKIDLLPKDTSQPRVLSWIHETVKSYCGLISPRDADYEQRRLMKERGWVRAGEKEAGVLGRNNVHLVSCQSGVGMQSLMNSLVTLGAANGNRIYVMGAANVGKSSFINKLLDTDKKTNTQRSKKSSNTPLATVSNLPGTTLDFIKIKLPNGLTVIDTPGLINKGQLTSKLTTQELKQIIPVKPINAVTLRVTEGKCVLIGGLARIDLTEGRPVFFTFYVSNEVKLHPTDVDKADEFLEKHTGTLITPPASYDRVKELGPYDTHTFEIEGDSWKKAANDIVIAGLGWIAVTGPGKCTINLSVPQGTSVGMRSSLMPFDAMHTTAKFTGGRLAKKSSRPGVKGYGWRA